MDKLLVKRTPDSSFSNILDFPYKPKYIESANFSNECKVSVRLAYIDEEIDKKTNSTMLFLHGLPTWSYLWRHFMPDALKNNYRVVALDLPGFGRSDKPTDSKFYSFETLRNSIVFLIKELDLQNITLVMHEWGGTLGLTLPMEMPEKNKKVICFNSYLATGTIRISDSYREWIKHTSENTDLNVRGLMARTNRILTLLECNNYHAPFPDQSFKTALYSLPAHFPINKTNSGAIISQKAEEWWKKSDIDDNILFCGTRDPLVPMDYMKRLAQVIPCNNIVNTLNNAGHFVPEWAMEFSKVLFSELNNTNSEK